MLFGRRHEQRHQFFHECQRLDRAMHVEIGLFFTRDALQNVGLEGDSIVFKSQGDFQSDAFKNKWIAYYSKLRDSLKVGTMTVPITLEKVTRAPFVSYGTSVWR